MSNELTTIQMNRAICEFTGWEFKPDGEDWFKAYHEGELMWAASGKELNKILLEGFKFHEDWNKLMPVGKKIRDLLTEMQKKRPPHTACNGDLIEVDIRCAVSEYDIVNAHKHMYTFITWYNQQKQNAVNDDIKI